MADPRFFAKLDVGYFDNPKVADFIEDQPRVLLLHLRAITYCRQHLTDGIFPIRSVVRLACASYCGSQCDAQCDFCACVDAGLIARVDDRNAEVHDYLKHQDSAEQIANRKSAGQTAAAARWGKSTDANGNANGNAGRIAKGNAEERRGEERTSEAPRKRGTRIPDDFAVTDDMRSWAKEKGYGHLDLNTLTEEFFDYWSALPGSKALKLDWTKTWKNRVREVAARTAPRPNMPTAVPQLPTIAEVRRMEAEREARERGESA